MSKSALPKIVLIALLIGGTALRLDFARHAVPFGDDYGTAALMSKHILEGREYPLYFYGYAYIGALGSYVGAATFALFGPSLFSLCLAMLLFALLWMFATYLLFRRLVGEWAGVIATAVVAFPSAVMMHYSVVPLIGYPPTFAIGTLVLYLGVRLTDPDLTGRAEWLCVLGLGALAGLGIWTNPLCVAYLVIGFGLLTVHVVRSRLRRALLLTLSVAFMLFVVALLPVIVMAHRRGIHDMFGHWPVGPRFIGGNVRVMLSNYLPTQLLPGSHTPQVINWVVQAVYAMLGVGFVVGLAAALAKRDRRVVRAALVPLAFAVVFLLLFLSNSKSLTVTTRYFTPFYLAVVGCVAFPLAHRRAWLTGAAAVAAAVLVVGNTVDVLGLTHGERAPDVARESAGTEELVRRAEAEGLRHVMIQNYYGQAMTFVADERVIFARTRRERYYPYALSAARDDHVGFAKPDRGAPTFVETLRAVGVTSFKSFSAGGWTVFYSIELPTEQLRLVEPASVSLVGPEGDTAGGAALIDRNDETLLGDLYSPQNAILVQFPRDVRLSAVRFVAPEPGDYPVSYTLLGSMKGSDWARIKRVEQGGTLTCVLGNRLYHDGRYTPTEVRFEPTALRHLKICGFIPASPSYKVWRFEEAYFYEYAGEGDRPDRHEAADIARELERRGVERIICDEWLSRKIEQASGPRLDVLPHYELRRPRSHVSRVVPMRRGIAVVVETAHAEEAGRLLAEAMLGEAVLVRHDFPHYTAHIIQEAPSNYESFPGLKWDRFTVVGTACIAAAEWYSRHGEQLDRAGDRDRAVRYFTRSFDTFPGIRANLERLAPHDEEAAGMLAALTPEAEAGIRFPHGVSLVGYTLTPSPLVPGKRATLRLVWQLEGPVKHDFMQVFVHFVADDKRLFQADHNAVFPVFPGSTVPRALVLDEHEFDVPAGVTAGHVTIHLGATAVSDRTIRLKPRTKLPVRQRAVEIGRTPIAR